MGSLQQPGCVLVRLYGRMTELYVNREREMEIFQVFHAHGRGPQIYCSFQNGICYEFVRGRVLEDELLQQPSIYRCLGSHSHGYTFTATNIMMTRVQCGYLIIKERLIFRLTRYQVTSLL